MRPALYIELCCGSASTALALTCGRKAGPLVGYMGGKRRWAGWHLEALGLRPGEGAEHVLLGDAGPWGWVWPVVLDVETGPQVAEVLRGWRDRDPRELWEELAGLPPAPSVVERTAQWLWLQGRSASNTPLWWDKAGAAVICKGGTQTPTNARQKGRWGTDSMPGIKDPATVADRIAAVQAAATWLVLQAGSALGKPVGVRADGSWQHHGFAHLSDLARAKGFKARLQPHLLAAKVEALRPLRQQPVSVWGGLVEDLQPEGDHSRTVVVFDPPYRGATGYAADCPRQTVVEVARRWEAAGAVVLVCEAEPLLELEGWYHYEVTHLGRKGCGPEWVTMSRPALTRQQSLLVAR